MVLLFNEKFSIISVGQMFSLNSSFLLSCFPLNISSTALEYRIILGFSLPEEKLSSEEIFGF